MTVRVEHPQGLSPPQEWVTTGHAPAGEFREWMQGKHQPQKRSKFGARVGRREDLGLILRSSLEANTLRLLLFTGYTLWRDKATPPPAEGKYVRYEGHRFVFEIRDKAGVVIKTDNYLPDFELWDGGAYSVLETKGYMDQRSKTKAKRMRQYYPEVSYEIVTREELQSRMAEVLYEARRRGQMVTQIPGWEG